MDEANDLLKAKVFRNTSQKFENLGLSFASSLLVKLYGRIFLTSFLWETVHQRKNGDEVQRIIQNLGVQKNWCRRKSERFNSKTKKLMVFAKKWIGQNAIGAKYSLRDGRVSEQLKSKVYLFSDSVLFLGGQCPTHQLAAPVWEGARVGCFVETRDSGNHHLHDIKGALVEFVCICPEDTSQFRGGVISMSKYNDIHWDQNRNEEAYKEYATRDASFAKDFDAVCNHCCHQQAQYLHSSGNVVQRQKARMKSSISKRKSTSHRSK